MTQTIICIVVGLSIGITIGHIETLNKQAAELRAENQELRRDIEALRIKQGQIPRGKA